MTTDQTLLSYKAVEVILYASLTVNLCVVFYVVLPWLFKLTKRDKELTLSLQTNVPAFINRVSSSLPFYVAFPICSLVLIFTSNVLQNPFFVFDRPLRIAFSTALGQYIYKSAESLYWHSHTNYKPVLIHHGVVIAIYAVILYYEQCAVIGLVGLLLKGSFAFAEFDYGRLSGVLQRRQPSNALMIASTAVFLIAIVLKGLVPGFLVLFSVATSSDDLLKMQYLPLSFFFLGLVFFSAVSGWFIKDAFYGLKDLMRCCKHPKEIKFNSQIQQPTTVINHQGLVQLIETGHGAAIVQCNDLWDKDLSSLCSAHALQSKVHNSDVVEIECETPAVVKTTNISTSQRQDSLLNST
ncbi:hypothetical protein QZH41_013045 [Actinostola sp. cb2023]|nr:hypothetical protein QZH41_013045 [Actinostola sp. cb2023]